jgi:hypothetical protein
MRSTKKKKGNKKEKVVPVNPKAELVKTLIKYTSAEIKNDGSDLDELFINQLKRLNKELEELK